VDLAQLMLDALDEYRYVDMKRNELVQAIEKYVTDSGHELNDSMRRTFLMQFRNDSAKSMRYFKDISSPSSEDYNTILSALAETFEIDSFHQILATAPKDISFDSEFALFSNALVCKDLLKLRMAMERQSDFPMELLKKSVNTPSFDDKAFVADLANLLREYDIAAPFLDSE